MRPLRLLAFLAVLLLPPALPVRAVAAPAPRSPRPVVVAVFGDSLVDEAADYLRYFGHLEGVEVRVRSQGGTALCDWLPEIRAAVTDRRIAAVALAFTGNNLTACTAHATGVALAERYAADARTVLAAARPGLPTVWVEGPAAWYPNPDGAGVEAEIAAAVAPRGTVVDGAAAITPGGRWSMTQPCLPAEPCLGPHGTNVVRSPDGVHFCPTGGPAVEGRTQPCRTYASGARRYATAILAPLLASTGVP